MTSIDEKFDDAIEVAEDLLEDVDDRVAERLVSYAIEQLEEGKECELAQQQQELEAEDDG